MNSLAEVMPIRPAISRGTILKRVFVVGYLTAVAVAMFGWLSAFGWLTVKVAQWLLA
jgi:hypothetical protein